MTPEETTLPSVLHPKVDRDIHSYAVKSWHRILHKDLDPQKLCPFIGFRPLEIVCKTLKNTTQLARLIIRYPMRTYIKARFPHLNNQRLQEGISTDRLYSNCADVGFGYTSAHVFLSVLQTILSGSISL